MTDKLLHAVVVPTDAQTGAGSRRQQQLAKKGVLDSDVSSTEPIAPEPGTITLSGQYRGRYAPMLSSMVEEIFDSSIGVVPYAARNGQSQADGYYAAEDLPESGPVDPREERVQSFTGKLAQVGTRRSHWRAIRTKPQTADNPFGSASTPEFGLSSTARKVRWFDAVGGSLEDATVQRSVDGEHDTLDIYDASEPSFADPVLIYDIPYRDEYPSDCTVWDDYNRDKVYRETTSSTTVGTATVGSATVAEETVVESQWQRVYSTDHEWRGNIVLETDRLRLTIDQPDDVLRAYRWDESDAQYNIVQLGQSDWRLFDIDITKIGLVRIEAQLEFENTSNGNRHNLNLTLVRGLDNGVWTVPENEGSTPSGLIDRLDPIADDSDDVVEASGDVIKRTEVDR